MTTFSVKVPTPRQLGQTETIETLKHRQMSFRNYYRRDSYYSGFLEEDTTWNPLLPNYGLAAEGQNTTLRRTAAQLKLDLVAFLHLTAAYLPFSYVTERFEKNTTSFQDVFRVIAELYDAEISCDSFLDFAAMDKSHNETHCQFFERLALLTFVALK